MCLRWISNVVCVMGHLTDHIVDASPGSVSPEYVPYVNYLVIQYPMISIHSMQGEWDGGGYLFRFAVLEPLCRSKNYVRWFTVDL